VEAKEGRATLTVVGHGTVSTEADVLSLSLSVTATAGSGPAALADAQPRAGALTALLDELGVPVEDRGSTGISLGPHHVNEGGAWIARGWEATFQVRVRLHSAEVATRLVVEAAQRADARIDYSQWSLSETHQARSEAARRAVADASQRAAVIAESLRRKLGPLLSVADHTDRFGAVAMRVGGSPAPQLQAGTVDVSASIDMTFALE
jgi:uncharacterized protein YggE